MTLKMVHCHLNSWCMITGPFRNLVQFLKCSKNKVRCKGWNMQQTLTRRFNIHQRYHLKPGPVHHCRSGTFVNLESPWGQRTIWRLQTLCNVLQLFQQVREGRPPICIHLNIKNNLLVWRGTKWRLLQEKYQYSKCLLHCSINFNIAASSLVFSPISVTVLSTHKCLTLKPKTSKTLLFVETLPICSFWPAPIGPQASLWSRPECEHIHTV